MKIPEDDDFEAMRRIAETCGEIAKSRGFDALCDKINLSAD